MKILVGCGESQTPAAGFLYALAAMVADGLHTLHVRPAPVVRGREGNYRKETQAKTHGDQSARDKFRKVKRRRNRVGK